MEKNKKELIFVQKNYSHLNPPPINTQTFIELHADDDINALALARRRYPELSDEEWQLCLRQIEGRQKARHKLPEIAAAGDWLYPARLSMEQCSSELTAKYKQLIISNTGAEVLIDLTGGFGIDCHYMSAAVQEAHYVERNADLCRIAEHNLRIARNNIHIHHSDAETFIMSGEAELLLQKRAVVYLDPARRSANGGKVFRIEDCEPDIRQLLPVLRAHANINILLKLSPMLDISAAQRTLGGGWQVHVTAAGGEVKEVLMMRQAETGNSTEEPETTAIDLKKQTLFRFRQTEERECVCPLCEGLKHYIYEPDSAILKAGAYKLAGARFGLEKLAANTHLYTSDQYIKDFPGRVFRLTDEQPQKGGSYHVMTRNHPLKPEQLARQLRVKEGGEKFVIGARTGNKAVVVVAETVH